MFGKLRFPMIDDTQQRARPNSVPILCAGLGDGDLGCHGNPVIRTPSLDRFASESARFTDFYTTSRVCTPTRAAIVTGRYPRRYGIHHADLPECPPRYPLPGEAVRAPRCSRRLATTPRTSASGIWASRRMV